MSYALFPQVATEFFKYREAQQTGVDQAIADTENGKLSGVGYENNYEPKDARRVSFGLFCVLGMETGINSNIYY